MATSPASPDKPLVSVSDKAVDNTGWVVAMIQSQKELLLAIIEANDVRYDQRFEASKEAITSALAAAKEAITAALSAADRAVLKAESAAEKRFESVNEFRSTLADQQRTLMPRMEAEQVFKNLAEKIEVMEKRMTHNASSREGVGLGWGYALGAIGLIGTILSIVAVAMALMRT